MASLLLLLCSFAIFQHLQAQDVKTCTVYFDEKSKSLMVTPEAQSPHVAFATFEDETAKNG